MLIAHSSDVHGRYATVVQFLNDSEADIWIDTGDFFPNSTRGDVEVEPSFQKDWAEKHGIGAKLVRALHGRPLICVPGNHDYTSLAEIVRRAGGTAYDMTEGEALLMGHVFAGFREIPWIIGEWNGECFDFDEIINRTMSADPTILVTHCPPAGILDDGFGIPKLASALAYLPHQILHHFFGHIHVAGGRDEVMGGMEFHNSAERIRHITV
jgi:Icc-related predicted phosphoesterase